MIVLENVVSFLNELLWSPVMIYFCLGVGLLFSIITRFLQVHYYSLFTSAPF